MALPPGAFVACSGDSVCYVASTSRDGGLTWSTQSNSQFVKPVSRDDHPGYGKIRFAHAVANGPAVDVHIDDDIEHSKFKAALAGINFHSLTSFLRIQAGPRHIKVAIAGTTTVLKELTFDVAVGAATTLIIHGDATKLETIGVLPLSTFAECADGDQMSHLRVVHAAIGVPPASVMAEATPLATDLAYGNATPYQTVRPGVLTVSVKGTDLQVPVKAKPGAYHSLIVVGGLGDVPLMMIVAHDNHGACVVYEF